MKSQKTNRSTFSLRYAMYLVGIIAVGSALVGTVVRREAARRAEWVKRAEAYQEHASTMDDQIAATVALVGQERKQIEYKLQMAGLPKGTSSGQTNGMDGWKYELKMGGSTDLLVNVVAYANIVDGELTPITIATGNGSEDERLANLLVEVYSQSGWEHNRVKSPDVEPATATQKVN